MPPLPPASGRLDPRRSPDGTTRRIRAPNTAVDPPCGPRAPVPPGFCRFRSDRQSAPDGIAAGGAPASANDLRLGRSLPANGGPRPQEGPTATGFRARRPARAAQPRKPPTANSGQLRAPLPTSRLPPRIPPNARSPKATAVPTPIDRPHELATRPTDPSLLRDADKPLFRDADNPAVESGRDSPLARFQGARRPADCQCGFSLALGHDGPENPPRHPVILPDLRRGWESLPTEKRPIQERLNLR